MAWKLYVEHEVEPPVRFYEKKPHPKASALKRALAIHRNPGWGLKVLSLEEANGERMEAAEINAWCERNGLSEWYENKISRYSVTAIGCAERLLDGLLNTRSRGITASVAIISSL